MEPLVILVADSNMRAAMQGLFRRPQALGIRPIQPEILVHPHRDPGVRTGAHTFLRSFTSRYLYALVMFDREGCGQEQKSASQIEQDVQARLDTVGWKGRSKVIVIDPELEVWVWSRSPQVLRVLGISSQEMQRIYQRYGTNPYGKPLRPKEALEEVLRRQRRPRSSAIYRELATRVSLRRCTDPAFRELLTVLRQWFS